MNRSRATLTRFVFALCALALIVPASWAGSGGTRSKSHSTAKKSTHSKTTAHASRVSSKKSRSKRRTRSRKPRGQQAIDSSRASEIQAALITQHYLQGEPSGKWDARTKAALVKYQHDNGWQTKLVPDSRALIKLGLGPSHDGLLNPESAAIGNPRELGMARDLPTDPTPRQK